MTAAQDMIRGRSNIVTLTNNSGGALVAGDVCVQDTTGDEYVTTTTSAASVLKVFVAAESIANGATGKFYESGYCPLVNVNASVTRGRFLFTHTVAKQSAENATYGAGAFGKILKSGTTPSAIIYSATAQSAGGGASTADPFVIGAGTAADLSAAIQIPGLSGSPDKKGVGVNDDEFEALSGWTTLGALDTLNVTDFASHVHMVKTTSGNSVDGIYKASPGEAFTMTAKMSGMLYGANYNGGGIMIAEASPGKLWTVGPLWDGAGTTSYNQVRLWTNRTSPSTSSDYTIIRPFFNTAIYLRIVATSSTSVAFLASNNGFVWIPLVSGYNPGFTIGSVGLWMSGYGAIRCEQVFDWIRFT